MRGWSFSVGRYLGVEVRIHIFFALLLVLSVSYATVAGISGARGVSLWLLLLFAIVIREVARSIAAAWFGLELRSLLLLPTGGLPTFASRQDTERAATPKIQLALAIVGPISNIIVGLAFAGFIVGMTPEIHLLDRPWITPAYLLRSMVWMQLLLGAVNLLPASPLDGGRVLRSRLTQAGGGIQRLRQATLLGQAVSIALVIAGFLTNNFWVMMMGIFVMVGAPIEDQGLLLESTVDTVRMRDIMLTEYSTLSASATLEDAAAQAAHTLQDVFPVVRGGNLVGAVSRQGIFEALQSEGNGYVQGVMTRAFHTAQPDDSLVKTLKRITNASGAQLVPVLEGERVVGIVTPQNLSQSMGILSQIRKLQDRNARIARMNSEE